MSRHIFILSILPVTAAVMLHGRDNESQSTTAHSDWLAFEKLMSDSRVSYLNAQFTCRSPKYKKYKNNLYSRKFSLKALRLPPNKKILIFGHSYMGNLWMNIATANVEQMSKFESRADPGDSGGYHVSTYLNGAEVTLVQNYDKMQTSDNIGNLKRLMSRENFDLSFFMNPHRECWFADRHNRETTGENHGCESSKPDPRIMSENGQIYWEVISRGTKGRTIEIAEWNSRDDRKIIPHTNSNAHINGLDLMEGFGCNADENCKNQSDVIGHQCIPSVLTLVAKEMASHFF